jgi:tRNA(Met) cytidine acetyltransferase
MKKSDPVLNNYSKIAAALTAEAKAANQRRILVFAGQHLWCIQATKTALKGTALRRVLWITDIPPEGAWSIKGTQAHKVLGRESDAVVFDAHSGFDPDAFGAIVGTIRGGGLLFLLTPVLEQWPNFDDPFKARMAVYPYRGAEVSGRFLARLARILKANEVALIVEQDSLSPRLPATPRKTAITPNNRGPYRTEDQRRAVEAVMKVATGHRRRPLVLTSDRGRGKSAALGIAAARLLRRGLQRIIITAPRRVAVEALFEHASKELGNITATQGGLRLGKACIDFVAPDELTLAPRPAELVLVDEAAAIPHPLLERMLRHYARIAFASTIHGYEGAGRGFAIRFQQTLDQLTPLWRALHLEAPIRWAADDPLERLLFRSLILDANPAPDAIASQATPQGCLLERLNRDRLADDEDTLCELFALLTLAHYQTRPTDLRHLLDGPNLGVTVMRYEGHVVATALTADEGGLDTELARQVFEGRRRVRGHLLPQTFLAHLGLQQAAGLHATRIIRIAVHPAAQHRGLGTLLLKTIVDQALTECHDYVGSSFGATAGLLQFWRQSNFLPLRLGVTRGTTTGTHSVMVLQPLSAPGKRLYTIARNRFHAHLSQMLCDPLQDLDPYLCSVLLQGNDTIPPTPRLETQDWHEIVAFAFALRGYEASLVPIRKLVYAALANPLSSKLLNAPQRDILITKVVQQKNWKEVAADVGFSGRGAVIEALRHALRPLVLHFGDSVVQHEAERLIRQ